MQLTEIQYRWILHDGAGGSWQQFDGDTSGRVGWDHAAAAEHFGLDLDRCAKGVLHVSGTKATCAVQTPDLLSTVDMQQLQHIARLHGAVMAVLYFHPEAREKDKEHKR